MDYPDELTVRMDLGAFKRHQKAVREELGCSNAQCFCTGRCRRTAEEQAQHEAAESFFNKMEK